MCDIRTSPALKDGVQGHHRIQYAVLLWVEYFPRKAGKLGKPTNLTKSDGQESKMCIFGEAKVTSKAEEIHPLVTYPG